MAVRQLRSVPVASPDFGTKRLCPTTGRKFYDLGKDPVSSPYSGEVIPIAPTTTVLPRRPAPAVARQAPANEEEAEVDGPELVSLDEVEAEEAEKDTDADTDADGTGDDALPIEEEDEDDNGTVDDTSLTIDEDEDDTNDLVDVNDDDDEDR